jgi:hypothetical protein
MFNLHPTEVVRIDILEMKKEINANAFVPDLYEFLPLHVKQTTQSLLLVKKVHEFALEPTFDL